MNKVKIKIKIQFQCLISEFKYQHRSVFEDYKNQSLIRN